MPLCDYATMIKMLLLMMMPMLLLLLLLLLLMIKVRIVGLGEMIQIHESCPKCMGSNASKTCTA